MRSLKNERGGALLLVLFSLILVTMFVMFQLKQVVTVRQQIKVAEVDIDARNIANMGLTYFREEVELIRSMPDYDKDSCSNIERYIPSNITTSKVELDPDHFFQVEYIGCKGAIDDIDGITVEFKSTGTAFGKSIIENGSFKIGKVDIPEVNPVNN